jgi:PAS domain S-box-containing protein
MTGFTHDELIGRRLEDVSHPDDADDLERSRRAFAGEIPRHRAQARFITKRGDVVRVLQTATAVRGPDDRPANGLLVVDPIYAG